MLLEPHSEASAEAQEITLWGPANCAPYPVPGGDESGMNLKELEDEEEG